MSSDQLIPEDVAVAELIPAAIAFENFIAPWRLLAGTLIVAAASPLPEELREKLAFVLNRKIHGIVRTPEWIAVRQHELYGEQQSVDDSDHPTTWYWPHWHYFDGDKLVVKVSGWMDAIHWTGPDEFPRDHPDYDMWRWIVGIPQYHRLVDVDEIPAIRRIWKRYVARCDPTRRGRRAESSA